MSDDDTSLYSSIKDSLKYSTLLLICVILLMVVFIGTKDKININFSKKENKRILMVIVLLLAYSYRSFFDYMYKEIKKDALEPGTGVIGETMKQSKEKLMEINDGYLGNKYEELKETVSELQEPMEMNDSVNQEIANQLKYEGAIGYIIIEDGTFYSIKPSTTSRDKFVLESKLDRSTMRNKIIDIDVTNKEYIEIYKTKKYVENLFVNNDIKKVLIAPSSDNLYG